MLPHKDLRPAAPATGPSTTEPSTNTNHHLLPSLSPHIQIDDSEGHRDGLNIHKSGALQHSDKLRRGRKAADRGRQITSMANWFLKRLANRRQQVFEISEMSVLIPGNRGTPNWRIARRPSRTNRAGHLSASKLGMFYVPNVLTPQVAASAAESRTGSRGRRRAPAGDRLAALAACALCLGPIASIDAAKSTPRTCLAPCLQRHVGSAGANVEQALSSGQLQRSDALARQCWSIPALRTRLRRS